MENNTTELRFEYFLGEADLEDIQLASGELLKKIPRYTDVWFRVTIELVEGEMPNDPL